MNNKYTQEIEKIEEILNDFLPSVPSSEWYNQIFPNLDFNRFLAEPLLAPVRDLFKRGGKRWRPLLSHLVCRALGGGDAALPLLPLIEFTHNASLIHDDIEDNSDQRRGKPSVHLIYGSDTAINSGSFLYFFAPIVLENWKGEAEDKNRLWALWAKYLRFLHLGQAIDIAWHRDPSNIPTMDDYLIMCSLKTGCLSRFAAILGAEAAGIVLKNAPVDPKHINQELSVFIGDAAQKLGVGFQILDDVKNLSTGVKGKKRGDDVVEGKKSLPVLLFLHSDKKHKAKRAAFIKRCFTAAKEGGTDVPEVEEFIAALTEAGALEEAEKKGRALINEAGAAFSALNAVDSEAKELLCGLPELLLNAGS
jgi:octaprenyl-diphosphate synthase